MPITVANPVACGALCVTWFIFCLQMLRMRLGARAETGATKRDLGSIFGIALQGMGIAAAWIGTTRFDWPPQPEDWLGAAAPSVISVLSAALFWWSAQTMGANWSLVARTREDHKLVQNGPFAVVRNPIYVALFGMMCATAMALGHALHLLVAVPLYVVGTVVRVGIEERLLRETFGAPFDAYARRVKRFIPGVW